MCNPIPRKRTFLHPDTPCFGGRQAPAAAYEMIKSPSSTEQPQSVGAVEGLNCQSFRQGCAGCCLNMRWQEEKLRRFLERNTEAAERILPRGGRPGFLRLARLHLARGGLLDHVLAFWLIAPSFALSVLAWRRFSGSCRFAGFIDKRAGRVGCLIHPARLGTPDCRRHAFPMIPTVECDTRMRCPMLKAGDADLSAGWFQASRRGAESLKKANIKKKNR